MKKLLVSVIVLILLLPTIGFAATNVDLKDMSYEELVSLFEEVQLALFGRSLSEGVEIPYGDYVVGQDIPAGGYVVSLTGDENGLIFVAGYLLGASETDTEWFSYVRNDESFRFTLSDGMKVSVQALGPKHSGKIVLKTFAGLFAN